MRKKPPYLRSRLVNRHDHGNLGDKLLVLRDKHAKETSAKGAGGVEACS